MSRTALGATVLVLLAAVRVGAPAGAQPFERVVDPFPVTSGGDALPFAFYGGLAAPRVQLADADADGDLDLFLQDRADALAFFENVGAAGAPRYRWRTDRYGGLAVGEWARVRDLDDDGDLDVLAEQPFSRVRYYRNTGPPGAARFALAADTLDAFVRPARAAPRDTALVIDRQNVPALGDLDCDGRDDLFTATIDQGTLVYYAGTASDDGTPRFRFVSSAYGGIQIISFGKTGTARHGANALAVGDVDGDGDPDLLWGDFFSSSLYLLENVGRCGAPELTRAADVFPAGFRTSGYNAPHLADVDADGDLDLFVGVLSGASGTSPNADANLFLFERAGDGYTLRTDQYLPMIDVGAGAAPAAGDFDGDLDLDLVVGEEVDAGDPSGAALRLLVGDGSPAAPAVRAGGTVLRLDGYGLAPAAGDLDADGDPDLAVGTFGGRVAFVRNDGGTLVLARDTLVSVRDRVPGISGSASTPTLGDVDGDGDLDLLVGEASGALNLFRNDGTRTDPRFAFVTDAYLPTDATRSAPHLADLDGDGDLDLLVGTEAGRILRFRNDGTPATPAFAPEPALEALAFRALTPTTADFDADGDLDVVAGTAAGGLLYFRSARIRTRRTEEPVRGVVEPVVAPNPSGGAAVLRFTLDAPGRLVVEVFDLLGRRVAQPVDAPRAAGAQHVDLGDALAPGVYVYRIALDGGVVASGRFVRVGG